ncbi:hypothetical protein B0I33_10391 [Prauserella shujinwangii]|uniref:Uncharacterized protein n=1 Tax=Prauserella shujinwangii TaxID=1453103 RepID=A0A2T0LY63_9PSEU|nr:Rv3235 family protein [Prauserella shujinwangii]PRX49058.1 hypothetical protein B0I33_10391 [Prauserella shujinwangii]
MRMTSPAGGLLPLTPYEPIRYGDGPARPAVPAGQLSLDDLLAEVPAQRTPVPRPRPDLDKRRVHGLLTALLEVYAGGRPATQLGTWLAPPIQRRLRERARVVGPRYTLPKVHASRPATGAVEVCGTAHVGRRAVAAVARFQYRAGAWCCTYFGVLEPGGVRP